MPPTTPHFNQTLPLGLMKKISSAPLAKFVNVAKELCFPAEEKPWKPGAGIARAIG
jgi:hypothetical protein